MFGGRKRSNFYKTNYWVIWKSGKLDDNIIHVRHALRHSGRRQRQRRRTSSSAPRLTGCRTWLLAGLLTSQDHALAVYEPLQRRQLAAKSHWNSSRSQKMPGMSMSITAGRSKTSAKRSRAITPRNAMRACQGDRPSPTGSSECGLTHLNGTAYGTRPRFKVQMGDKLSAPSFERPEGHL